MWLLLLIYLAPVFLAGVAIIRATSEIKRAEILFPAGAILGLAIFVFLNNLLSFLTPGKWAIIFSYLMLSSVALFISKFKKGLWKIDYPKNKALFFWVLSILSWLGLITWKVNHALIGSDTNLYYGVASTLIKGNFPPLTPWQPDIPLFYHLGSSQILASFHFLTNLSFEFLHLSFAAVFIFCSSQIIIWLLRRHDNFLSFLWGNLAAALVLISFGFLKIAAVQIPFKLPQTSSIHELFLWIRDLPTVNQSIEVYGAPVNLDGMIYFIFHSFGFALSLTLLAVLLYPLARNFIATFITILVGVSSLALINESVFVAAGPSIIVFTLLFHVKSMIKNKMVIIILLLLTGLIVLLQGGVVTGRSSVLFFPSKEDIKEDFIAYHYNQSRSKMLPFGWFHVGADAMVVFSLAFILFGKFEQRQKLLMFTLFASGILSLAAYYFVVPKFLIANGNRLLAFSHIYLSLVLAYGFFLIVTRLRKKIIGIMLTIFLLVVIFLPTIMPPLALLTKNRFGENKLIPKYEQVPDAIEWIRKNLPYDTRVMVLDQRAPHPSGLSRVLVQAGVFTPVFTGENRAYTIEASPEYIDIAYFLDPDALEKLKIKVLYVDSKFFEGLPEIRKKQLSDEKYFKVLFSKSYPDQSYEKVLEVEDRFYKEGGELDGTIRQLTNLLSTATGRIYIDNEENFEYDFLRRPIIFSLRQKDLYFLPQSGVYLNVEATINQQSPRIDLAYDYLILGKNTKPGDFCHCQPRLIWQGLRDSVFLWQTSQANP